jgi:hypothetical protein
MMLAAIALILLVMTGHVRAEPESGGFCAPTRRDAPIAGRYALRCSGTLPPVSASLVMTCRCSHTFISAEPSSAPV